MIKAKILGTFLFFPIIVSATDLKPWFTKEYEIELHLSALYQNYDKIHSSGHGDPCRCRHDRHYREHQHNRLHGTQNDAFGIFSVEYPFDRYCGEFETTIASTYKQKGCIDNFRFTGRYQWFAEIYGDLFALTSGLTLTQPLSKALHDVSSFHHGHLDVEFNLSFGREYGYQCNGEYQFRWWQVLTGGVADQGKPWLREEAYWEYRFGKGHTVRALASLFWGFGQHHLYIKHFQGYACVKYRAAEVGIRYSYTLGCWGILNLQYVRRVYAYNFPANTNLLLFEYSFPFGTQLPYNY